MRKVACLMLLAMCTPALGQEMEPGEWEFATSMSAPGMPQAQTFTNKRCVTKEDQDPSRWADKQQGKSDCKVSPSKKSGGTYSWDVSCPSSGMKGTGTARVTSSTVESEMRLVADMGGQKMEMLNKTTGKRLGACKK
jgi:Protein of unknown function (DUF3617)